MKKLISLLLSLMLLTLLPLVALADTEKTAAARPLPASRTISASARGAYAIKISWSNVANAGGFALYRAQSEDGEYSLVCESRATKRWYIDKSLESGKTYYYRVATLTNGVRPTSALSTYAFATTIDISKPMVALTYDDGPSTKTTAILLDALERRDAVATFFVLGNRMGSGSSLVKRAATLGNEIGIHGYSHTKLTTLSSAKIRSELSRTAALIEKAAGVKPKIMRPPYGSTSRSMLAATAYPAIIWSLDTLDWKYKDSTRLIKLVSSKAKDGDVVLMHDIHTTTVKAAEELITQLQEKGFQLVTVTQLALYKRKKLSRGVRYFSF